MNKQITTALLFIGMILSALMLNAQPAYRDYVITTKGDSIRCKVKKPLIGNLRYQSEKMSAPEEVTEENIKEYSRSNRTKIYRAVYLGNFKKPIFMTVIERGKISIYELVQTNSYYGGAGGTFTNTSQTDWYVGKNTDTVVSFKTSGFFIGKSRQERKDMLGEMFKDNPEVYNKYIAEDKFNFKQIRNLVHMYNTGENLLQD